MLLIKFFFDFGKLGGFVDSPINFIIPQYYRNYNLAAQKGLFTHVETKIESDEQFLIKAEKGIKFEPECLESLIKRSFSEDKYFQDVPILKKYKIKKCQSRKLMVYLVELGYTYGKVFPGYNGVAQQVKNMYRTMEDTSFYIKK